MWLILLWQRHPCHPQPGHRLRIWSHSPWQSWRSAESDSSPALWGPPNRTQTHMDLCPIHLLYFSSVFFLYTSKSWLAMLKWGDLRMSQPSRLFTMMPKCMQEKYLVVEMMQLIYTFENNDDILRIHMHVIVLCCSYPQSPHFPGEV